MSRTIKYLFDDNKKDIYPRNIMDVDTGRSVVKLIFIEKIYIILATQLFESLFNFSFRIKFKLKFLL